MRCRRTPGAAYRCLPLERCCRGSSTKKHHRELSAGKAKEIISHLEQARQYFESAETAGILSGPLEQYYGVLAFARAIVLFRDPRAREATLKKGHGLTAILSDGERLQEITIKLGRGTFSDLLAATGNLEKSSINDLGQGAGLGEGFSTMQLEQRLAPPPEHAKIVLTDLLARMPPLRHLFEKALATRPNCYEGFVTVTFAGSRLELDIMGGQYGLPPPEVLRQSLGIPQDSALIVPRSQEGQTAVFEVTRRVGEGTVYNSIPHVGTARMLGQALIERFQGGWSLNRLATFFMASHVMSSLVRYYPTRWAQLVNHERDDRLLPLVSELRRLIQRGYPEMVFTEFDR